MELEKMRDALRTRRAELEEALIQADHDRHEAFKAIGAENRPLDDDEFEALIEAYEEAYKEADRIEEWLEEVKGDLTTLSDAISIYYKWRREGL